MAFIGVEGMLGVAFILVVVWPLAVISKTAVWSPYRFFNKDVVAATVHSMSTVAELWFRLGAAQTL